MTLNRGALRGLPVGMQGLQARQGGSWASNAGRVNTDELRMWNRADDSYYGVGIPWGMKMMNVNPQRHASALAFPGDLGAVINVGTGNFLLNQTAPFSSVFNTAGTYYCTGDSNANGSVLETNHTIRNLPGVACSLPVTSSVIAVPLWLADGAACSLISNGTFADIRSFLSAATVNGGTLSIGTLYNFHAKANLNNPGVTVAQRSGFRIDEDTSAAGTITSQVGLDCDFLTFATTNTEVELAHDVTQTLTASPGTAFLRVGNNCNLTLNYANASMKNALRFNPTILYQQTGGLGTNIVVSDNATIKNVSSVNSITLGTLRSFQSAPTITADTQTAINGGTYVGFFSGPTSSVISTGVMTAATWTNFQANATVGASTTITTRTGLVVNDATGAGTITTQIGVDIPAFSAGTTNIGIRNANDTRLAGNVRIGDLTAAAYALSFATAASATNAISMGNTTTDTTSPTSNANMTVSLYKGSGGNFYFMIKFNDGGTVRYKYLQLNTAGITWTQGTTAPT